MKQRKLWIPLNIQFFAEGGEENGAEGQGEENQDQKATFDDILKDKDYQSAFDKKIAKALETAKSKWETDYTTKLEAAKTEAEKLSKMKAEEKAQYELDKKQRELDEQMKAFNLKSLKFEAQSQLIDGGLPKEFVDFLNYESAETVKSSIDTLGKAFQSALEKAVNERLGSSEPPKKGGNNTDSELEKLKKIMGI